MSEPLIECVPNISEGRDRSVIDAIAAQVETVDGVRLLDVDPGASTNRTVVTFVGPPAAVIEAAVRLARKTAELIDMRHHHGEHPRMGALDVCPLVPVSGITMDETVTHARELARRLGEEVGISVYCYERAALRPERRNLADVRAGEYERLAERMGRPDHRPDFGPATFNSRLGATAVGARNFLVAYNINLNTTSTRRANAIAFDVRERGRPRRNGDPLTGEIVRDAGGEPEMVPGSLKAVKAIGWFIEEFGIAQISMNLTDLSVTAIHEAFDETVARAAERGVRVTGSELVGLVPLQAMLEAGRHYLRRQKRSLGVPDRELIKIAVRSLGLDELSPFKPEEKIIEYAIADRSRARLLDRSVLGFVEEVAAESVAPGGGSVAALLGALGAALGAMVANLSAHKRGWDDRWEEFSRAAERGQGLSVELARLVDEDTAAFNGILAAMRLPRATPAEVAERERALQAATLDAIEVPLKVLRAAVAALEVVRAMAEEGNPASASDAGVGAICARGAAMGAHLNVLTNLSGLDDKALGQKLRDEADTLRDRAIAAETEILRIAQERM